MNSRSAHQWIVSPWFDLCLFCNLWWLLAWIPLLVSPEGTSRLEFWQIYFLTTPHRWLTLILVATDADRRQGLNRLFLGIALVAALVVLLTFSWMVAFVCLALVDYVWNSWHFAAQHGGILRIYARKNGGGRPLFVTISVRVFVTFVCLR